MDINEFQKRWLLRYINQDYFKIPVKGGAIFPQDDNIGILDIGFLYQAYNVYEKTFFTGMGAEVDNAFGPNAEEYNKAYSISPAEIYSSTIYNEEGQPVVLDFRIDITQMTTKEFKRFNYQDIAISYRFHPSEIQTWSEEYYHFAELYYESRASKIYNPENATRRGGDLELYEEWYSLYVSIICKLSINNGIRVMILSENHPFSYYVSKIKDTGYGEHGKGNYIGWLSSNVDYFSYGEKIYQRKYIKIDEVYVLDLVELNGSFKDNILIVREKGLKYQNCIGGGIHQRLQDINEGTYLSSDTYQGLNYRMSCYLPEGNYTLKFNQGSYEQKIEDEEISIQIRKNSITRISPRLLFNRYIIDVVEGGNINKIQPTRINYEGTDFKEDLSIDGADIYPINIPTQILTIYDMNGTVLGSNHTINPLYDGYVLGYFNFIGTDGKVYGTNLIESYAYKRGINEKGNEFVIGLPDAEREYLPLPTYPHEFYSSGDDNKLKSVLYGDGRSALPIAPEDGGSYLSFPSMDVYMSLTNCPTEGTVLKRVHYVSANFEANVSSQSEILLATSIKDKTEKNLGIMSPFGSTEIVISSSGGSLPHQVSGYPGYAGTCLKNDKWTGKIVGSSTSVSWIVSNDFYRTSNYDISIQERSNRELVQQCQDILIKWKD